jgi:hypothetical protein
MRDYESLPGYDAWISREPEYAEEPIEDEEEEIPEPLIGEEWDGGRGEYVYTADFDSGSRYTIVQAKAGPFVGDWEIHGPKGFFSDGFASDEAAINWLCDPERRDW